MEKTTNSEVPLVSICCQTFNHKEYIEEAINSFLMQKTNFSFEILLRDDASTDGTQEIVREFARQYPVIIQPLIYSENQFQKGVKPFMDNVKRAKGKYIAICEGDDYWKDPLKLQKQVDFLESNKDYSLCFTNRINYNQSTAAFESAKPVKQFDFDLIDYLDKGKNGIITATATAMFRSSIFKKFNLEEFSEYYKKSIAGDTFLFSIVLTEGKGKILKDITTVYRLTGKGLSSKFTNSLVYKIRITTFSFLLDKKLVKNKNDKIFLEKKLKKLKRNYLKNKFLTFTNKIGLNSVYKIIFKK